MFESLFSSEGLSLDRLRNFAAFADAGSIVGAAPSDLARQSLISRQLGELERFFGLELTKKQGRGKVLTDAGRRLAALVREQLGALDEFKREAHDLPATLAIVSPNSIATWLLMPRLVAIRKALPHQQLVLRHDQTAGIVQGVIEGSHDIGFLRETILPRTMGRKAVAGAGFALFVPKALLGRLNPKEPHSWLRLPMALPLGGQLRASVDQLATKFGVTLSPVLACDSYVQAAAAVVSGAVASVLPVIAAPTVALRGVEMRLIPELVERRQKTLMIWNKRVAEARQSVKAAVEALPGLLEVD